MVPARFSRSSAPALTGSSDRRDRGRLIGGSRVPCRIQIWQSEYDAAMNRQYIFQMESLTKKHGQREVLKNVWLSFFPGAKIGVLGRNGAGKSTLLLSLIHI